MALVRPGWAAPLISLCPHGPRILGGRPNQRLAESLCETFRSSHPPVTPFGSHTPVLRRVSDRHHLDPRHNGPGPHKVDRRNHRPRRVGRRNRRDRGRTSRRNNPGPRRLRTVPLGRNGPLPSWPRHHRRRTHRQPRSAAFSERSDPSRWSSASWWPSWSPH
jgi:hypothetical protein